MHQARGRTIGGRLNLNIVCLFVASTAVTGFGGRTTRASGNNNLVKFKLEGFSTNLR
jgi:hypothetical protein